MRIGSLFSGAGGLDMAVENVFGGEVVWQSEVDKAASKVLAYRFPCAPNLGDITQIDWKKVEPVDVLCGGFPCQDVSAAGKRAGIKDGTRSGLWAVFPEAIDQLRPRFVVIENVRGLLSAAAHRAVESDDAAMGNGAGRPVLRAAGAVLGDLADIGYDAVWTTVAASDVGAPHRRERVFIVARAADAKGDGWDGRPGDQLSVGSGDLRRVGGQGTTVVGDGGGLHVPHSPRNRWDEGRPESAGIVGGFDAAVSGDADGRVELLPTPVVTDAMGARNSTAWRSNPDHGISIGDTLTDAMWKLAADRGEMELPTGPTRGGGDEPGVALLPTPCAQQSGNSPEEHLRKKPGRRVVTDLAILVENGLLESGGALLPTPNASDASGGGQHPDKQEGHSRQLIDYVLAPSQWGKYAPAIARWEALTRPAPAPTEPNKNGNPRLSAAFSEWLMGWPAGWVTDPAIGISRNDQLRIVGNGVVSIQAEAALRYLLAVTHD